MTVCEHAEVILSPNEKRTKYADLQFFEEDGDKGPHIDESLVKILETNWRTPKTLELPLPIVFLTLLIATEIKGLVTDSFDRKIMKCFAAINAINSSHVPSFLHRIYLTKTTYHQVAGRKAASTKKGARLVPSTYNTYIQGKYFLGKWRGNFLRARSSNSRKSYNYQHNRGYNQYQGNQQ